MHAPWSFAMVTLGKIGAGEGLSMNTKTKRRMMAVTGIIVIVLIVILAVVGGAGAARAATISEAIAGTYADQKIQVSGNVVENSYTTEGNVLVFAIYDKDGDPDEQLTVRYEGGVSATFGNDVTAICTGKIDSEGILRASELVTKCPSKYENATDALSVSQLIEYGEKVYDKPVKVAAQVKAGSLAAAGSAERFVLDGGDGKTLPVSYDGALSDEISDGSKLVVTGSYSSNGVFSATDVALEG